MKGENNYSRPSGWQMANRAAAACAVIAAKAGLGLYIINAQGAFNVNGVWTGVIMICVLIAVLTALIGVVERRMLRWLPDHGSGPSGL